MKLNHVSLPVADVRATRVFFERYLGFRCTVEMGADRFVGLTDNAGMLLTISNLDGVGEVIYPKYFHIGFRKDSDVQVDDVYERLKADGFAVGERENMHGRAVQRCRVSHVESAPPHLRSEVKRLVARGISETADV